MEIATEIDVAVLYCNRLRDQTLDIYLEIVHLLLTFTAKLTFRNKTSLLVCMQNDKRQVQKRVRIIQLKHGNNPKQVQLILGVKCFGNKS